MTARDLIGRIAAMVAGAPSPLTLIIDDAHLAGAILESGVVTVLRRLTQGRLMFAVAGSPEILPWFAPRLPTPDSVFTANDLAMTSDEIVADADQRGEPLTATEADSRHHLTQGWPIALHLQQFDGRGGQGPTDFGREGVLVTYIESTVLASLPPRMREFILTTTTCTRLTSALARTLSGDADSASLLEQCVASGLFLERFHDGDGTVVYRWHDAFADACRRIVLRTDSERSRALEAIAADTLAHRYPVEALRHSLRADDPQRTLALIRSSWLRIIVDHGARPLHTSCLALPKPLAEDAEILMIRASCANLLGDRDAARALAAAAHAHPHATGDTFTDTDAFAQLFLTDVQDDLQAAVDRAQKLVEAATPDPDVHAYRLFLLGWTRLRLRRQPLEAIRLLRASSEEARLTDRTILAHRADLNLQFALTFSGQFTAAERSATASAVAATDADDWDHYDGGIGIFTLGFRAYWQGNLADAENRFRILVDLDGHEESYTALARVYLAFLAALSADQHRMREAKNLLTRIGRTEMHGVPWPVYRAIAHAELSAAAGDMERAMHLVDTLSTQHNVPIVRASCADLARRAGQLGLAMELLAGLTEPERRVSYVAVSAETTAALVAHERGDTARAHARLERALTAATHENIVRPFLTKDPRIREILADHARGGTGHPEFVAARLAELERTPADDRRGNVLSARELQILGYLRSSMTASEVAAALFVSVNTVRTHQRAIYRKLGVTNRRDALRVTL
nr:LuxR C-terminal-related transcriptional regulator [Microbacterium sp. Leaf320]